MNLGILVLVAALILFGLLAFKQINALILAPLVTIFVIVCSGLPILESLKTAFMPAASDYVTSYFLVFFVGALFGAVYQFTGAAASIAKTLSKVSRDKFVAPIIMCITGLLTFGGVSGFVVFFVIYPIALQMFKRANITRRLLPAAISAGCWTWSMTAPGSPSIQNVIAMTNLGTPSTAAFTPSLIASIVEFVLIFVWLEMRAKQFTKKGIVFDDPTLRALDPEELEGADEDDLPNFIISIIPIAVILICNTAAHTIGAAIAGAQFGKLYGNSWLWIFSLIFTLAMVQYTEILPKNLGVRFNKTVLAYTAHGLQVMGVILLPLIKLVYFFNRPFEVKNEEDINDTADEISALAGEARDSQQINQRQERIIKAAPRPPSR